MTSTKAQHFRFLGILIGVAIRTSKPIAINLAPIVWKLLGCAKLSWQDLEDVDYLYAKSLSNLKDIDINGIYQVLIFLGCFKLDNRYQCISNCKRCS